MDISLVELQFYFAFILSLFLYYMFPKTIRWYFLVAVSLIFLIFSSEKYVPIYTLLSADITFLSTIGIAKHRKSYKKKVWLYIGVIGNATMLLVLKYLDFFLENTNAIARILSGIPNLIEIPYWAAPIGISYYTLSAIGYIVDCYWGTCEPSGNFLKDLLYICYWPVLTSGPILKFADISDQLFKEHRFDIDRICFGIQRMLWGIIKKIVISTRLGVIVDTIYGDTLTYDGFYIWVAAVAFIFQLYTDFSGCMDIILGASECYGIILPENFRMPFFSKSVQEFWQRWHITLGSWYKEYILYPLLNTKWLMGIERKYKKKYNRKVGRLISSCIGMLFVWLLFGLWHGGKWKFVAMGLYFYVILVFETITNDWFAALWDKIGAPTKTWGWKLLQSLKVFVLVTIGNMFFRLQNIKVTITTWKLGFKWNPWIFFDDSLYNLGLSRKNFNLLLIGLGILLIVSLYKRKGNVRGMIASQPLPVRWTIYLVLLFVPIVFGIYGSGYDAQAFIYGGF